LSRKLRQRYDGAEAAFCILGIGLVWLLWIVAGLALAGSSAASTEDAVSRVKSGTGFFVSRDGFLVTSAHVVAGCENVSVWQSDGTERPSYIIASDRRLDLALLWAEGKAAGHSAVVARATPQSGEDVFTLGYGVIATKPLQPVLVEGSLVGDSTARPGNRIMVIRAKLQAGNSGGAVLSGDGSLLGMVIGRDEEHAELGVALPRADIEALLSAYGITLPTGAVAGDARDLLSAISVLIQCSSSSN
jgi:S1-C subfamily serine protease